MYIKNSISVPDSGSIKIVQGDDIDLVFTIKDKTDTAVNITGSLAVTFKAKLKKDGVAGDSYLSKTLGAGITLTTPASGILTVALSDTDTSDDALPAGEYIFELQITNSAGKISTVRDFNDNLGILEVLEDLDQ